MVNFDTLATYSYQRFYSAIDSGKLITAFGIVRSFAVAFDLKQTVIEVDKLRESFKKKVGVDLVDVMALGLFRLYQVIEFETKRGVVKINGYDIYRSLYSFQIDLQDVFNKALMQSLHNVGEEDERGSEFLKKITEDAINVPK